MKKVIRFTMLVVTIILMSSVSFASNNIDVMIEDKLVDFNRSHNGQNLGSPYVTNGRTYIPVRAVSEHLGYEVAWVQETQTAIIEKEETRVEITIGETTALVNGVRKSIDVDENGKSRDTKAVIKNNRTYVPVRFISEAMGDTVEYRQPSTSPVKNRTVYINSTNLPVVTLGGSSQGSLSEYTSEEIEYARVWLHFFDYTDTEELYVGFNSAGERVNPYDDVDVNYPEDVIVLSGKQMLGAHITYSRNGDGTINIYATPSRWPHEEHLDQSMKEYTKEIIDNTRKIHIDLHDDEKIKQLIKKMNIEN